MLLDGLEETDDDAELEGEDDLEELGLVLGETDADGLLETDDETLALLDGDELTLEDGLTEEEIDEDAEEDTEEDGLLEMDELGDEPTILNSANAWVPLHQAFLSNHVVSPVTEVVLSIAVGVVGFVLEVDR